MSKIKIEKISITDLETDAIVNAANDGLWADGKFMGCLGFPNCRYTRKI